VSPLTSPSVAPLFDRPPLAVCVLGGSGFVGAELVPRLARAGHTVRVPTRNLRHVDHLLVLSSVELLVGDIHSETFLERAVADCDVVVNLVGILNERGRDGAGFRHVHVELMRKLLRAATGRTRRVLHVSALGADAEHGASHYLRTKGEAEQLLRASARLDWTVFRPSLIFGPRDSLVNRFASLLRLSRGWLPLARAGTRFAPIYVGDVAAALMRALHGRETSRQTYELCGRDTLTLREIVRVTAAAARLPCHLVPLPDALGRLQARLAELIPGKPFSRDNFRSLERDGLCSENGCARLGLEPVSFGTTVADLVGARPPRHYYQQYHAEAELRGRA
jgi:uncharacterized protein YbjT (DUF2867 family)